MRVRLLLISFAILLGGCPPSEKKAPEKTSEAAHDVCSRVGQTCEVSPGKLGSCVQRDDCSDAKASCFTCQSQH